MEVNIKALHFEASAQLTEFINKKAEKLLRRYPSIMTFEATLKVIKPETSMNKEATILVVATQKEDLVAAKVADTFEEAIDLAIDAVERQLERKKNTK